MADKGRAIIPSCVPSTDERTDESSDGRTNRRTEQNLFCVCDGNITDGQTDRRTTPCNIVSRLTFQFCAFLPILPHSTPVQILNKFKTSRTNMNRHELVELMLALIRSAFLTIFQTEIDAVELRCRCCGADGMHVHIVLFSWR